MDHVQGGTSDHQILEGMVAVEDRSRDGWGPRGPVGACCPARGHVAGGAGDCVVAAS